MGAWLCTSSKNAAKSDVTLHDSSLPEKDHRELSRTTSTGITNSVRKNETIESTPSTTKNLVEKKEGEEIINIIPKTETTFAESQFYARTSTTPCSKRQDFNEKKIIPTKQESIEFISSKPARPLSNPFDRLRPLDLQNRSDELSLQIFDQPIVPINQNEISSKIIPEQQVDDNNDSSTSTTTRSIHLPVEKQRGLSEVIRKRNSKSKVEDYKRSIQKPSPPEEQELLIDSTEKYFNVPINVQNTEDKRAQMSIERLNLLLTKDKPEENVEEKFSVADKKNIFEIISKDTQIGGTLPRSKSFKTEDSSVIITTKYPKENQSSQPENETYDDDISKLSFKEKMILFNKQKPMGLTPTSSLKSNRNRLTQPITAEEVQAAVNLTPASSTKQLSAEPEQSEIIIPVNKKCVEQLNEPKPSTRKTPTLKYNAKKTNTDQEQRAKTVDIVRLKADSTVKPKDTNKTNGTSILTTTKSNKNVISVLKSDTISVLKPDDHLDDFFGDSTKTIKEESTVQLNTDDLNQIAQNTIRLQSQTARVRPPRRQQQGAKNPLRQIQATIPTETEYTEVHTNLSEQELRRLKRAQIGENAGMAQEALAALATTENFAEINLRKVNQSSIAKFGFEPYKELMLILIKGRRHCSLRLINSTYESINEGDCYLLISPLKVFAWIGRHANSYEKAKTTDLLDYLKQHRDFGLRNEVKYFLLDQGKDDTENDIHAEFRDILQGDIDDYKSMDDVIDDDFYEANITELNRVYRVENDLLMPLNEFCFHSLSIKILDPNDVFVFDFGSELYVWNGKYADKTKRNMGLQLAQQLWNDTYDYSECIINPFDPLDDKNEQINQSGSKRPTWCIFGKQNQNVETLLFKGKFPDWPNDLQELKSGNDTTNNTNKLPATQRPLSIVETLKPADVHSMLDDQQDNSVNLIVDQINLGRGRSWFNPVDKSGHDIQTVSLNVWYINDNDRHELSKTSYGQFYSDDVYIIRWKYKLIPIGNVKKADITRDRVVYWIWQGINANLNEKGISGIMSGLLNEEKGVNIHVTQEHEEAAFLQLFDGLLTIHMGKRNQLKEKKSHWRLYIFLGEIDVETHWWEINVNSTNLRSRTSFLLINNIENLMLLWHGCGTTDEQQRLAKNSVMKLRERCPEEFHFEGESDDLEFFEMQEGDEIELFWDGINEKNHERKYNSLLNFRSDPELFSTMRIFHLSSLHGPFIAQEFVYSLRSSNHVSSFPFKQSELYELHQPALCLIDTDNELYVWQGWNDQSDDELGLQLSNANLLARGPKDIRFTTERRCAFRTAIDYYKTKTNSSTVDFPCSIVYAGLEPIDFTNLFPKWTVNTKARQQNQLEGKKINQKDSVIDTLNQLCREQYTIEELRTRPLPEGVDPSKIESYLSDADFQKEFHMNKDEFYALPYWKQTNIKKPLGYF